jgi:hypothetical protein
MIIVALILSLFIFASQAQAKTTDIEALRNALTRATVNSMLTQQEKIAGKLFERTFTNEESLQEALQAAELYRETISIENAISVNILPILVQRMGNKYFSHLPEVGLDNRYEAAMRTLISALYSGDAETLKKIKQEIVDIELELITTGTVKTEGEWKVVRVKTDLLTINLKQLQTRSYETLYEKVQEAFQRMSYNDIVRFYNDNKHLFLKEDRENIQKLIQAPQSKRKTRKAS